MMAQKHLHELLQEDQEPFLLQNYIADRRIQLKKQPISKSKTTLQIKNRKPNSCFSSITKSPEVRNSPFLNFPAPANTKTPNSVFLQIPSKTSALILESAIKIQKNSFSSKPRKTQIRNVGFGLLGSILKKLGRKSPGKCEKVQENVVCVCEKSGKELGFSRSCSHIRRESAVWSESNEEKSLDFETSNSYRSEDDFEDIEFESDERESEAFSCLQQSPFRFALQNSASSGVQSPAASPSRHKKEERENNGETIKKIQSNEKEEEKDQFSPVSVLDPPFEDEDEEHEGGDKEEDDYDLECTYAIIQRSKRQLLHHLRRFEKLAELDPIELEKRMLEEQDDEDENEFIDKEEESFDEFIKEVLGKTSLQISKVSGDTKRLVSDLIAEEEREENESEIMVKRVCKRLDSWKEMESKTIDMMVELDFQRDIDGWKIIREEMGETAKEIEIAIFGVLIEELMEELVCQTGV